jgi:hypothetical protein
MGSNPQLTAETRRRGGAEISAEKNRNKKRDERNEREREERELSRYGELL